MVALVMRSIDKACWNTKVHDIVQSNLSMAKLIFMAGLDILDGFMTLIMLTLGSVTV